VGQAASTALQISGAVLSVTRSLSNRLLKDSPFSALVLDSLRQRIGVIGSGLV
jgi:hypothetical protein